MDLYDQYRFTPLELEFMAENELIYVCPNVTIKEPFEFLCGSFGPFVAGVNVCVPLWLALTLKDSKKARIVLPDWMQVGALERTIEWEEENEEGGFYPGDLPFHYVETAEMILRGAEDDFAGEGDSAERISDLIRTLIVIREHKLVKGVEAILKTTVSGDYFDKNTVQMDNASAMEVADLREGFMRVSVGGEGEWGGLSVFAGKPWSSPRHSVRTLTAHFHTLTHARAFRTLTPNPPGRPWIR